MVNNTSFLEWAFFAIPLIPIIYFFNKFQDFNFKIGNEILRALLQLVELGCMLLLLPYSLFILMFPMVWLYEIVGWFAIILFPLIYVFIIVKVSEFYMKYKKNKSNDI